MIPVGMADDLQRHRPDTPLTKIGQQNFLRLGSALVGCIASVVDPDLVAVLHNHRQALCNIEHRQNRVIGIRWRGQ